MAEVLILSVIAGLLVALAVASFWRCKKPECKVMTEEGARNFMLFGVVFMVVSLLSTYTVHGPEYTMNALLNFELTLFNVGLLFFLVCLACTAVHRKRKKLKGTAAIV